MAMLDSRTIYKVEKDGALYAERWVKTFEWHLVRMFDGEWHDDPEYAPISADIFESYVACFDGELSNAVFNPVPTYDSEGFIPVSESMWDGE